MHPSRGFSKNSNSPHGSKGPEITLTARIPGCPPTLDIWRACQLFQIQLYLETPDQRCYRYSSINSELQFLSKEGVCAVQNSGIISLIFRKKYLHSITLLIRRQGRKNMEVAMHAASVSKRLITGADTALIGSGGGRGRAACQAWPRGAGKRRAVFNSKSGERCPLYLSPAAACLDDH